MRSLKKFADWYFSREALPYWSILILDSLFVILAGLIAYAVNHDSVDMGEAIIPLLGTLCVFWICFLVGFRLFHTYYGVFRFSSFSDLGRVSLAILVGLVLVCALQWFFAPLNALVWFTASDLVMFGLFTIAFLWTVRIWVKTLYQYFIENGAIKRVEVEDLLPREEIDFNMEGAARLLSGHTVLITGAAGSIGEELVKQICIFRPVKLILVDQAETPMHDLQLTMHNEWPHIDAEIIVADVSDPVAMRRVFETYNPEYVFHAAAYKHVPMMEENPYESVMNNVVGTRNLADMAVKYGTRKFVMVSTDKAVNPTNVMGCSKRICEIYVQSLDKAIKEGQIEGITQFVTTRFGNVLGSSGSVIPLFERQIREGGPVTVTHPEIIRYFMLIPEACRLVVEAGTMGKGGEIYVFDMGKPVKIADLAKRMIKLSGAKNIEIKYTGLREGEKLYEEVLDDKEILVETYHPKIKVAKVREYSYDEACNDIDRLTEICRFGNDMEIVAVMKEIVPEYKSRNSIFERLDK